MESREVWRTNQRFLNPLPHSGFHLLILPGNRHRQRRIDELEHLDLRLHYPVCRCLVLRSRQKAVCWPRRVRTQGRVS